MHITDLPESRRKTAVMLTHIATTAAEAQDERAARSLTSEANLFKTAELFWVTKDMARVALDASTDMPSWRISDVAPVDSGLIVFDGGLPEMPDYYDAARLMYTGGDYLTQKNVERTGAFGQRSTPPTAPVDFVMWRIRGANLDLLYGQTQPGTDEPLRTMGIIGIPNLVHGELGAWEEGVLIPGTEMAWASNMLYLLGATWTLMRQENVAEARPQMIGSGKASRRPPAQVTTISLRRLRSVDTAPSDGGRVYKHRWLVRGHWRKQRSGVGNAVVTPTWIPSYVKGPPGAPLLANEKVMVWRR